MAAFTAKLATPIHSDDRRPAIVEAPPADVAACGTARARHRDTYAGLSGLIDGTGLLDNAARCQIGNGEHLRARPRGGKS